MTAINTKFKHCLAYVFIEKNEKTTYTSEVHEKFQDFNVRFTTHLTKACKY